MNVKSYNVPHELKNDKSFPFWFSMLSESNVLIDFTKINNVLDFGSGNGKFLKLFDFYFPNRNLIGAEIDNKLIEESNLSKCININYLNSEKLNDIDECFFELIYSQEVIYTLPDLFQHASEIFKLLKFGGHYMFSVGCHVDNPTWSYRIQNVLKTEKYHANNYSLEEIAKSFFDVGFRVSLKKLPVYYPLKYIPNETGEFKNINDLIESSENFKYLFILLKPSRVDNNE